MTNVNFKQYNLRERLDYVAEHYPQKVAFIFNMNNGLELTYSAIRDQSYMLARNLIALGLKKNERLAFLLPNTHEIVICYYACALAGLISVPLDADYGSNEIEYMIKKTEPSAVIIFDWPDYKNLIDDLFSEIDSCSLENFKSKKFTNLHHVITIDHESSVTRKIRPGAWSYTQLISKLIDLSDIEFPYVDSDDIFSIMFTVSLFKVVFKMVNIIKIKFYFIFFRAEQRLDLKVKT